MHSRKIPSSGKIFYFFAFIHSASWVASRTRNTKIKIKSRTSLVVQWLRIHLPTQGTWVRALVQEDPTCRGTTKPVCHND